MKKVINYFENINEHLYNIYLQKKWIILFYINIRYIRDKNIH